MILSLVSITPGWLDGVSLSNVVLKSHLRAHRPDWDVLTPAFTISRDPKDIAARIAADRPDAVGFSVYMWNLAVALAAAEELKRLAPDRPIIFGGPTAAQEAEFILADHSAVDLVVTGEGEQTLVAVLDELQKDQPDWSAPPGLVHRRANGPERTAPVQLDLTAQDHPLSAESFARTRQVYYETSRGCPFRCRYCAWNVNQQRPGVREYPLAKVLADLAALMALPGLEMLLLTDSNILLNEPRTEQIFQTFNRLNQDRKDQGLPLVKINFEFNPEHLSDGILPLIKQLHVENYPIGLQSVRPEVLREAKRAFNKADYLAGIDKLRTKAGAAVLVEVIFGLPGDDYEGFKETLEFLLSEIKAELFVCYRYSVLPGSSFWEHRADYGLVHQTRAPYLIISSDTYSEEDLAQTEWLTYHLQLIYRVFRSLKKYIDNNVTGPKLPVYEKISRLFRTEYGDRFPAKLVYDDRFLEDAAYLRSRKAAPLRRRMLARARGLVKQHMAESGPGVGR